MRTTERDITIIINLVQLGSMFSKDLPFNIYCKTCLSFLPNIQIENHPHCCRTTSCTHFSHTSSLSLTMVNGGCACSLSHKLWGVDVRGFLEMSKLERATNRFSKFGTVDKALPCKPNSSRNGRRLKFGTVDKGLSFKFNSLRAGRLKSGTVSKSLSFNKLAD